MKIFCRHAWKILDKTEGESAVDVMWELGKIPEGDVGEWAFRRRLLVIMACEKCGKTKVIRGEV